MSKVEFARKIFVENPSFTRKQLIEALMSQLNMTKAGATTYAYNLSKGQPKAAKPKTVKMSTVVAKANKEFRSKKGSEQTKEQRLELIKEVGKKQKAIQAEALKQQKDEMQAEVDQFLDEATAYVKTLTSPTRKFIGMAE